MSVPIVSLNEVDLQPRPPELAPPGRLAERFDARLVRLGPQLGLTKLGCSVIAVPPGRAAFPFHSHRANDELFVILDGEGELRLGQQRHAVAAGDVIGCPSGGPEGAHQLVNTGSDELRYLAISTMRSPEICEYPDSDKIGALASTAMARFAYIARRADGVGYWEDEPP
jgi:uncharacterized cupin superfamily protein